MTMNRDLDRALDVWMDEGPTALPDGAFDAAVAGLRRTTHVPRGGRPTWRNVTMSTRLLAAAALLVAFTALGVAILPGNPIVGPAQPTPTATPTESQSADSGCFAGPCLGRLTPGSYTTATFELPFSYSVPDGWANVGDQPQGYLVIDLADKDPSDLSPDLALAVYLDPYATSQDECNNQPEPGVGRSAGELMTWLASLPTVLAGEAFQATVFGLPAKGIDLSMAPGARQPCIDYVSLFNVPRVVTPAGAWLSLPSDEYLRIYLLDGPSNHTVFVGLWSNVSRDPSDQFGAGPEIVASLEFTP